MKFILTPLLAFCIIALNVSISHAQWVQSGLSSNYVGTLALNGSNLYAGTDTGLFLSTDNGSSWSEINNGLPRDYVGAILISGNDLFVAIADSTGSLYRSTDNGSNWTKSGLTGWVTCLIKSGSNLFAGLDNGTSQMGGVLLSTDNGLNWTASNNGLTGIRVEAFVEIGSSLYAGTEKGINLSTNNGDSWSNVGLANIFISCFANIDGNFFAGSSGKGIFLSIDNGTTWKFSSAGMPASPFVYDIASSGMNLFAATSAGVFLSTNNGSNWTSVNTDLPPVHLNGSGVGPLAIAGSNIFVGSGWYVPKGDGIWKRPLSDFGSSEVNEESQIDAQIELSPNPSEGLITVNSGISGEQYITITNILGEVVMEIPKQYEPSFTINISKFVQGNYFIRFMSGISVATKMIVKE